MSIPYFDYETGTDTVRSRIREITMWADDTGRVRSAIRRVSTNARAAEKRRSMMGLPAKVRT